MILLGGIIILTVLPFSLKLNARKASQKSALSEGAREKLKSWLAADYHLYNHFAKKLEDKMVKFGKNRLAAEGELGCEGEV